MNEKKTEPVSASAYDILGSGLSVDVWGPKVQSGPIRCKAACPVIESIIVTLVSARFWVIPDLNTHKLHTHTWSVLWTADSTGQSFKMLPRCVPPSLFLLLSPPYLPLYPLPIYSFIYRILQSHLLHHSRFSFSAASLSLRLSMFVLIWCHSLVDATICIQKVSTIIIIISGRNWGKDVKRDNQW